MLLVANFVASATTFSPAVGVKALLSTLATGGLANEQVAAALVASGLDETETLHLADAKQVMERVFRVKNLLHRSRGKPLNERLKQLMPEGMLTRDSTEVLLIVECLPKWSRRSRRL